MWTTYINGGQTKNIYNQIKEKQGSMGKISGLPSQQKMSWRNYIFRETATTKQRILITTIISIKGIEAIISEGNYILCKL